jgi:hypothetical protein
MRGDAKGNDGSHEADKLFIAARDLAMIQDILFCMYMVY